MLSDQSATDRAECPIAPLPDMQTCAICGYLAVGSWQDGGLFVCATCSAAGHASRSDDDDDDRADAPACPLCGEDVWPANVSVDTGVPWGRHHHAHALCALENLAARVAELERALGRTVGTMRPRV